MAETSPTVYLLHGNNEFEIRSFLDDRLKAKMGDQANASMDITTLDGKVCELDQVRNETHSIPFLSDRRMVIIHHPRSLAKGKTKQEKFINLLESIPLTTACVLVVDDLLKENHWLLRWGANHPQNCWIKSFIHPQGRAMTRWIMDQASELGGEFSMQGAQLLASYVNEDPRLAAKEIEKLLFYVDFSRPVTETDVQLLTPDVRQGDVFDMVDAIGNGDGKTAMKMMHRLLEESDPLPLFGMIVRQFRLLIQVREQLEEMPGRDHQAIAGELGVHPYPIKKIMPQAQHFNLDQLTGIYQKLSEIDQAMKTGQLDSHLALDILVASLTQ
jgi:DNA polymerase-3 subunit delta